ncbi:MAG: DUF2167 domain-containing protein [Planctomycetaceae bacterium]|jgi:uncharacterized membrane-anchored protein|nr:DUF2167 domain-containing protein [Planctomycetaceae bacterium]
MLPFVRAFSLALGLLSFAPVALAFQEPEAEESGDALLAQDEAEADEDPFASIRWQVGPTEGKLGSRGKIQVPEGLVFANKPDTQKLMEMMQNPISNDELGLVGAPDLSWFVVFEFEDSGWVDDSDKDDLDADELLETLKEGNEAGNEERAKRGWSTLELLGWAVPPHYDTQTNNLEWATRSRSGEHITLNHNSRVLGRRGVMVVTLVCDEAQHTELLPQFQSLLRGFAYNSGERYSEYTSGDKVAEYGLTALVAGGAGALAVKSGLLGKLWKPIAVALVAIGAFFKKLFGGKKKETAPTRRASKPEATESDANDEPPAAK